jgi:hypothetical protein
MPPDHENLNMPPEQENLNRQLEALGRYVSGLQQQRERAKAAAAQAPAVAEPRRPSRGWLLLTGVLVILALVGGVLVGVVAWFDRRPAGPTGGPSVTQGPNTTTVVPVASLACKTAVDRANAMLTVAVSLQRELAEYRKIMSDPSNRKLSGRELVEKTLPVLGAGANESASLDQALSAYRQVVDQCKLRKP